jgi:hypothetical protein
MAWNKLTFCVHNMTSQFTLLDHVSRPYNTTGFYFLLHAVSLYNSIIVLDLKIWWHVEPLLGNGPEISSYTTAVTK